MPVRRVLFAVGEEGEDERDQQEADAIDLRIDDADDPVEREGGQGQGEGVGHALAEADRFTRLWFLDVDHRVGEAGHTPRSR